MASSHSSKLRRRMIALLLRTDLRRLGRDPVLLATLMVPVLLSSLLGFALPEVHARLAPLGVDLGPHLPVIAAFVVVLAAMMPGWVVGFFLLEERAQRTLMALGVTPLTLRGFVVWRLALPAVLALLGGLLAMAASARLLPDASSGLAAVLLASLCAPSFTLFLVGFADSEVEGLALAKIGGSAFVLPVVAIYVESPWGWLGGVMPTYWVARLYVGGPAWMLVPGLLGVSAWMLVLLRRLAARTS